MREINEPGIYPEFPTDAYHADPCPTPSLSSSIAKLLVHASPAHARYWHPRLNPDLPVEEFDSKKARGQAAHKMMLGRGADIVVITGYDDWRKKDAQELRADALAEGKIPLLERVADEARLMVDTGRYALGEAGIQLGEGPGVAEACVIARDPSGAWLRALVDWLQIDSQAKRAVITDYKTTAASAAPFSAPRLLAGMLYDFQGAFYERVLELVRPELAGRITFRLVVQEVEPPFELSVLELTEADLSVSRAQVRAGIARWTECLARDEWPGYPREVVRVALPPWHSQPWMERELNASMDESGASDWILAGRS